MLRTAIARSGIAVESFTPWLDGHLPVARHASEGTHERAAVDIVLVCECVHVSEVAPARVRSASGAGGDDLLGQDHRDRVSAQPAAVTTETSCGPGKTGSPTSTWNVGRAEASEQFMLTRTPE
jgi:hypothetical protein